MADGSFIEDTYDVFLMEKFNRIKNTERAQKFNFFLVVPKSKNALKLVREYSKT